MAPKVRLLQVIPHLRVGGAEWMVANLAAALDHNRYDVRVVTLFPPQNTPVEAALRHARVPVIYLDKHLGFDPTMFRKISLALRELRPDVVHTHLAVLQYALPALLLRRPRVVHTLHTVAEQELPRTGKIAHAISFRAGVAPVAIAGAVAESVRRVYGRDPAAVIPNAIPVSRFHAPTFARAHARERLGIFDDETVLAAVARLAHPKKPEWLIRALATMESAGKAVLLIVGDGPLRANMERLASNLGLSKRVRFLGTRGDVPEVLAAADVFVLASEWEGHPLSVMEAMSAGLPVVATQVGGIPELVDASTGILVAPGDIPGFAAAFDRLASDRAYRLEMAAAARRRAQERFDVAAMARAYEALYERLLGADAVRGKLTEE